MARDRFIPKREVLPDIKYNDVLVSKFINVMMLKGKRSVSQHIMYVALDKLEEKTETSALKAFEKAIDNVRPLVEVKSRRVGGATYQVP
ncbi:MAG: 30S ribosomal protein S7, partial [Spirochaetales bacterium]|nr:30S ribosomal protein S7 [Spirochaetales bacterium]